MWVDNPTGLAMGWLWRAGWLCLCLLAHPEAAQALEKYGRPLPSLGEVAEEGVAHPGEEEHHWVRGYLLSSVLVDNPTFAARPDNSGLAGLRHMVHLETDLYKEYLQFYTDQNFFSDRRKGWITLTEWDQTYALTGSWNNWGWRVQYEQDSPLDRSGTKQAYGDTLLTYRMTDANRWSWWRSMFPRQNISAYVGAGWLFHNQSYFARPDNTGRALYRYVAHTDIDLYRNLVVLFVDTNFFTDRTNGHALRPSELDWITGLALRWRDAEISLYHEQDTPLDRAGLVQRYTAIQVRVEFEFFRR